MSARLSRIGLVVLALSGSVLAAVACGGGESGAGSLRPTPPSSTPIGSFVVGPSGVRYQATGITVVVPPGAVPVDTAITISTLDGAPDGYVVDGKAFRFEPSGLHFAVPVAVTFTGAKEASVVFWSVENDETKYEPQKTEHGETGATAYVTHFSGGFAGAPAAGAADASVDANDASIDGGSDAGSCSPSAAVDPTSASSVTPSSIYPPGSFGCPNLAWSKPTTRFVRFTKPTRVVVWGARDATNGTAARETLRPGCDPNGVKLATAGNCTTQSVDVAPGDYTFVACTPYGRFTAHPLPVTAPTNTSCATATTVATSATSRPVYDATKLYYRYTAPTTGLYKLDLQDSLAAGSFRTEVQTSCDDALTDVYDSAKDADNDYNSLCLQGYDPSGLSGVVDLVNLNAGTTYWIVLSNLPQGAGPAISIFKW